MPWPPCWFCGNRRPNHTVLDCPQHPHNKGKDGICERPGCSRPQEPGFVTCLACRRYRRNVERVTPAPPPPYLSAGGEGAGISQPAPAGPVQYWSGYDTGSSAPPHPKRWHYVSPACSIPAGSYTYNALRRAVDPQGGW